MSKQKRTEAPFSNLIQHPEVHIFLKLKPKTLFVGSRSLFDFIQTNPLARRHGLEACTWICPPSLIADVDVPFRPAFLYLIARVDMLGELISKIIQHNVVPAVIFILFLYINGLPVITGQTPWHSILPNTNLRFPDQPKWLD